nr:hypothetical protein [uncultured Olsenella sp.]
MAKGQSATAKSTFGLDPRAQSVVALPIDSPMSPRVMSSPKRSRASATSVRRSSDSTLPRVQVAGAFSPWARRS